MNLIEAVNEFTNQLLELTNIVGELNHRVGTLENEALIFKAYLEGYEKGGSDGFNDIYNPPTKYPED